MQEPQYFFLSLEPDFFPPSAQETGRFIGNLPELHFSNGEMLFVDLLHPICQRPTDLVAWQQRVGPVALVTRIPVSTEASMHLEEEGFEIVYREQVMQRIAAKSTLVSRKSADRIH